MKKIYFLLTIFLGAAVGMQAQNSVTVDASADYIGYANVFETPANGEAFVFGDSWAVEDLKTVIDPAGGTITLQPNFNAYDAADPFWVDPDTGLGNKYFEGNTFVEDASLVGSELTFSGGVQSNDLDPSYETMAFIKVFNADFSVLKIETAPLVAGQNFSITYANVEPEDAVVQYGFSVYGRNANPDNEAALGSVVVVDEVLGVNQFDAATISTYPNPTSDVFNVNAEEPITSLIIHNVLGQQVIAIAPESNRTAVNVSTLKAGVYIAKITTASGAKTVKFVKQ